MDYEITQLNLTQAPNHQEATTVARLLSEDEECCPVCGNRFRNNTIERRRCWECYAFLLLPGETVEDIVEIRRKRGDAPIFELLPDRCERSIVIWERRLDGNAVVGGSQYYYKVP